MAIPLPSIFVMFIVAYANGIPMSVQIVAICVMFGLSAFVFYLMDRVSMASKARAHVASTRGYAEIHMTSCQS